MRPILIGLPVLALTAILGGEAIGRLTALPTLSHRASAALAIITMTLFMVTLTTLLLRRLTRRRQSDL